MLKVFQYMQIIDKLEKKVVCLFEIEDMINNLNTYLLPQAKGGSLRESREVLFRIRNGKGVF